MKFSQFFNTWLHELYYKQGVKIGKDGDFYTSVSVGSLFGTLIAKHFLSLIDNKILKFPCEVIEIGANEGFLSKDFLTALLMFRPSIFKDISFFIIEPHENLRLMQRKTLEGVEFLHKNSLKKCSFDNAFIFCNELFDSFTLELIDNDKMGFIDDFKIYFDDIDKELLKECKKINLKKGEFSTALLGFFEDLNLAFKKFIFASFDYGKKNINDFSLRIFKKHELINPFECDLKEFFGKSDLTYNVNFNHIFYLLKRYNFKLLAFEKQNVALLNFGFEELLKRYFKEEWLNQAKYLFFNFDEKFHFLEFQKI
ncbi:MULTISPECIES: SAM-dependent methyltransferase [unclassified Campylobacter]|uniref:SAM-dependent methyltransferase n=1 Tax=unclassified Campylobacter TaxID=2593542 RepID=UPI001237BC7A|nr:MULTISPECIES: SAM-dependent methyltransferase [unclassified Campylobacter]KAA6225492.1 hypothetical protein FMM55_06720 [Campylobacter sp. LR196d]KAA6227430.1 hypothetical protein FMM54_02865 [Campylobacter sp. LR185c]KAA6229763.1 hypothetical protein FMM57_00390 [Campylobacter sp. LR286c]KAA6234288.1 hypothetical protein FMM58_00365 [Campylobacter sp. LR291e]KAA8604102.1 hypothetical protein CGP82_04095 [Campylobacter sp. LR185c]